MASADMQWLVYSGERVVVQGSLGFLISPSNHMLCVVILFI